jgi:hypothetical protein
MELSNTRTRHLFMVESDSAGHRVSVDGHDFGTFATLDAAEAAANNIARCLVPAAVLRFELDFKWTLSDVEIRAATLECPGCGFPSAGEERRTDLVNA